jgi:tight adherence protein C
LKLFADVGSALTALALLFAAAAFFRRGAASIDSLLFPLAPEAPTPRRRLTSAESFLGSIGRTSLAQRFRHRARLERGLQLLGEPVSVEAVLGLKLVLSIVAGAPILFAGAAAGSAVAGVALSVLAGLGASLIPDLQISRRARRRQRRRAAGVPDLAELLVATTSAGLNPPLAFRRSAEILDGPLGDELRSAVRGLEFGMPWVGVLEELADRSENSSLRRLIRAMGRSQRLGTPLASALHSVAEDLRKERQARAEELARRAPVKMLFPLVFLILPAFLLLTIGPVLLATLRNLH